MQKLTPWSLHEPAHLRENHDFFFHMLRQMLHWTINGTSLCRGPWQMSGSPMIPTMGRRDGRPGLNRPRIFAVSLICQQWSQHCYRISALRKQAPDTQWIGPRLSFKSPRMSVGWRHVNCGKASTINHPTLRMGDLSIHWRSVSEFTTIFTTGVYFTTVWLLVGGFNLPLWKMMEIKSVGIPTESKKIIKIY